MSFDQSGTVDRFFGRVSGSLWDTKSASFRALALACCSRSNSDLLTFKAILFLPKTHRFMIILVIEQSQRRCKPGASLEPATSCLSVLHVLWHFYRTNHVVADDKWEERVVLVGRTGGAGGWWVLVGGGRWWAVVVLRDP